MYPFFSIIIASYNNHCSLQKCIDSLNIQSFQSYEILISDGGSCDGTILLLNNKIIKNLTWHKSSLDKGIYDALNLALPHVQGEWILILGSDDLLSDSHALDRAYKNIVRQNQHPFFYYSNIFIRNKGGIKLKTYPHIIDFEKIYLGAPFFHHQSVFLSKFALGKIGFFNAEYSIHSDYDMLTRANMVSKAIKIESAFVIYNANGFSSNLSNLYTSFCEIYKIRRRYNFPPISSRIIMIYIKLLINKFFS